MPENLTLAELAEDVLLLGLKLGTLAPGEAAAARREAERALSRFADGAVGQNHAARAAAAAEEGLRIFLDDRSSGAFAPPLFGGRDPGERFFELLGASDSDPGLFQAGQVLRICGVFGYRGRRAKESEEEADERLLRETEELWKRKTGRRKVRA